MVWSTTPWPVHEQWGTHLCKLHFSVVSSAVSHHLSWPRVWYDYEYDYTPCTVQNRPIHMPQGKHLHHKPLYAMSSATSQNPISWPTFEHDLACVKLLDQYTCHKTYIYPTSLSAHWALLLFWVSFHDPVHNMTYTSSCPGHQQTSLLQVFLSNEFPKRTHIQG